MTWRLVSYTIFATKTRRHKVLFNVFFFVTWGLSGYIFFIFVIATLKHILKMNLHQNYSEKNTEWLAKQIVNAAFNVHKKLGPGLLEKVYEVCFCYELSKIGIETKRQVEIPISYENMIFNEALRLDVLVEDCIICELKAVEIVNPVWQAQIISHLKLTNKNIGFLINFNVPIIKQGIKRYIV